eukprot:12289742-Heterocapsa_arctica.AAC.1
MLITTLEADEAPFAKVECQFDPTPYLGLFSAATFLEPRLLEPRPPPGLEVEPPALTSLPRQRGSKEELLKYIRLWDKAKRLVLVYAGEVHEEER